MDKLEPEWLQAPGWGLADQPQTGRRRRPQELRVCLPRQVWVSGTERLEKPHSALQSLIQSPPGQTQPGRWRLAQELSVRLLKQACNVLIGQRTENGVVMPTVLPTVGRRGPRPVCFVGTLLKQVPRQSLGRGRQKLITPQDKSQQPQRFPYGLPRPGPPPALWRGVQRLRVCGTERLERPHSRQAFF